MTGSTLEAEAESSCPLCKVAGEILRPAEPDVGIMQPLYACREHGEFFTDIAGAKHSVSAGLGP